MQYSEKTIMLAREDYQIIMYHIKRGLPAARFNRRDAEELEVELKKAILVDKEALPPDVIRLNSTVIIREEKENRIMQLKLVTPEKANIKEKLISIMSPIGTALIGFREGQQVKWTVPSGKKTFTIIEVKNRRR